MSKKIGNVLFLLTLISPVVSFSLASMLGEPEIFRVAGIVRYSWIMWLFIPIGLLSILVGLKLKNNKQKYKKNLIIAFVCLPIIIIFGSFRFIFNNISYDVDKVKVVENKSNLRLPDQIKIATNEFDSYNLSYIKIVDQESQVSFENELESNQLWQKELSPSIKGLLPIEIQYEMGSFDRFAFYIVGEDEYNTYPQDGTHECIFVAYDYELQRVIVLYDYIVEV